MIQLPDHPLTLPATAFTIKARPSGALETVDQSRALLKIKVTPSILIQSCLISKDALYRGLEELMHIIVPIGGRIEFAIKVKPDGLEGCDRSRVKQEVRERVLAGLERASTAGKPLKPQLMFLE
jgi:hypothetical protein